MGMNEIASLARSKHRCQAFGTSRSRGEQLEYLTHVKGSWRPDLFASIPGVWARSEEHAQGFSQMIEAFDFTNRAANRAAFRQYILPLMAQRSMWADPTDMQEVFASVNALKRNMSGLRVEVYSGQDPIISGEAYTVQVEVYNSSADQREVMMKDEGVDTTFFVGAGQKVNWAIERTAPSVVSTPFWLRKPHEHWRYDIDRIREIGTPIEPAPSVQYAIKLDNEWVYGSAPLHRKWNDRSVGEIIEPLVVVPAVTLTPSVRSKVVRKGEEWSIDVKLKAFNDFDDLIVNVELGTGMTLLDAVWPKQMSKGQERTVTVRFKNESINGMTSVAFFAVHNGQRYDQRQTVIDYDHIPYVIIHEPARVEVVPLELTYNPATRILYVEGSGDEVDDVLAELGYTIDRTSLNQLNPTQLAEYDVVITGIRAFNSNSELAANMQVLNDYVKGGGKLIVQYNTTYDLNVPQIGPYPLELSRNRVTDERAEVTLLQPKHPVFLSPNLLGPADWDQWVQERGLYFAGTWDKAYTPLIAWSDKDEEPLEGGLLVAKYGKGDVVYTGISFFRQLPSGVPGAIKLMVNLIEY
jgi:hypothetical protein